MNESKNIDRSYGFIVYRIEKGEIQLLILINGQSISKDWMFPRGHKEGAESDDYTARRELYEETGLVPDHVLDHEPLVQIFPIHVEGEQITRYLSLKIARINPYQVVRLDKKEAPVYQWVNQEFFNKKVTLEQMNQVGNEAFRIIEAYHNH